MFDPAPLGKLPAQERNKSYCADCKCDHAFFYPGLFQASISVCPLNRSVSSIYAQENWAVSINTRAGAPSPPSILNGKQ